jgi:hypothetical protein
MAKQKVVIVEPVSPEPEKPVEKEASPTKSAPEPPASISPVKKKRKVTEARLESLRKANEARLRKKILMEEEKRKEQERKQRESLEQLVLDVLQKHSKPEKASKPPLEYEHDAPPPPPTHRVYAVGRNNDLAAETARMIFRR